MDWKCKLVFPKTQDPNASGNHFAEIASFISKWTSKEGVSRVLLVLFIDCVFHYYVVLSFTLIQYLPHPAHPNFRFFSPVIKSCTGHCCFLWF